MDRGNSIRWENEQVLEYLKRFTEPARAKIQATVDVAISATNLEPTPKPETKRSNGSQEVHPRHRISVHQKRRRLTDPDGISAKAAIDGLVLGGLLPDDSPQWIQEVTFSQIKSQIEETIIEVWEILY